MLDVILNTTETLILQEEDAIYFIAKGGFHYANITKISETWYDIEPKDLDDKLRDAHRNQGLSNEEIEDEIEEFHKTEFYKHAVAYFEEE